MKPDTRTFYEQAVQRAIGHIVLSLDEALDLETLATSPSAFVERKHRRIELADSGGKNHEG